MGILKRVKFTNVDAAPRQMIANTDYNVALKSYSLYNENTSDVWVHFYDETSGTVVVGSTTAHYGPVLVPAGAQRFLGSDTESAPIFFFGENLCVAATTTEEGSTSPTLDITIELTYWGNQ